MRVELKALQRRLGVTVVFVTHDQIEALSLSDRLGLMSRGRLEQVGSPEEVYNRPATPFTRDFLGKTFSLKGKVLAVGNNEIQLELDGVAGTSLRANRLNGQTPGTELASGQEITLAVRPEQIAVSTSRPSAEVNVLPADVAGVHFLGDRYEYTVQIGSETRILVLPASEVLKPGQKVFLQFKSDAITLWPG
jgi:ABC-type Fe3+/spermidine/putrescine transport system ATPase subunit